MRDFTGSASGRVACATLGFGITAAGALALRGPGSYVIDVIPLIILVCIVGSIFAGGLAIEESWAHALAMLLALPFLAWPYVIGLHVVDQAGTLVGALLVGVGISLVTRGIGRIHVRARHQ